jgi:exopolysaccharide biosynthesis WecB/TagA/CpsF family protein
MTTQTHIKQATMMPSLIRGIDIVFSILLILMASPVLVLKFLYRKLRYGSAIEHVFIHGLDNKTITLYQFSGEGICCQWPQLINLLKGDISLLGTEKQYILPFLNEPTVINIQQSDERIQLNSRDLSLIKPGLISFKLMNQQMGLSFENQDLIIINAHKSALSYLLAITRTALISLLSTKQVNQNIDVIKLFDIKLSNLTMAEMLELIIDNAQRHATKKSDCYDSKITEKNNLMAQYAFANADCMNISTQNSQYRHCLQTRCDHVFADGSGIRIASICKGVAPKDNLNGTDMFPRLCEQAANAGLAIFLLGADKGVAAIAAKNMQLRYPKLKIAGTQHGFIDDPVAESKVIEEINNSGASILLVAMGAPRQELWLTKNKHQLNVGVGIGVGGLFDFYADKVKRAPLWVRQIGMEWVCRLSKEPKRMWKRYILGNPMYLYRVFKEVQMEKKQALKNLKQRQVSELALSQNLEVKAARLTNIESSNLSAINRCTRQRIQGKIGIIMKRSFDLVAASVILLMLLPFLLLTALVIRFESPGAVMFSQQRAGKNNAHFTMWKFRSMYRDAEQRLATLQAANEMQGGVLFKMKQDPRITRVGKIIRKASIDELPQLWNVILGDMSLVGPRPALLSEVKLYSMQDRKRLTVKPGITCIWQVSGRSDIPFAQQVQLDVDYIYQQSLLTDIWILIKTIPAVLLAKGSY